MRPILEAKCWNPIKGVTEIAVVHKADNGKPLAAATARRVDGSRLITVGTHLHTSPGEGEKCEVLERDYCNFDCRTATTEEFPTDTSGQIIALIKELDDFIAAETARPYPEK